MPAYQYSMSIKPAILSMFIQIATPIRNLVLCVCPLDYNR